MRRYELVSGGECETAGEALGGIRRGRLDRPQSQVGGAYVLVDEGAFGREKGAPRRQLEPRSSERVTSGKERPVIGQ